MKKKEENNYKCPRCKSTDLYYQSGDLVKKGESFYCRRCHTYFDKK